MDSSVFAPIKLYPVLIIYYALKFHQDFTHMSQPFKGNSRGHLVRQNWPWRALARMRVWEERGKIDKEKQVWTQGY